MLALLVCYAAIGCSTSLVSIVLFAWDKRAAKQDRPRIAERTLHLWSLAGGWPGALLARYWFRHKTVKQPFGWILWGMVAANSSLWLLVGWTIHTYF